jgi:serine/threonine protein kinase
MEQLPVGNEVLVTRQGIFENCRGIEGEGESFYYVDDRSRVNAIAGMSDTARWTTSNFGFDKFRNSARVCIRAGPHFQTAASFSIMKTFKDSESGIHEIACLKDITSKLILHSNIMSMENGFKIPYHPSPSVNITTKLNYLNIVDALMLHGTTWTFQRALTCMNQIISAISAIHKLNIAHLDIRCENFVFEEKGLSNIKLIDFEMAQKITKLDDPIEPREYYNLIRCGYAPCIPPEADRHDSFEWSDSVTYEYVLKKDIWGAGIVFFYLLTRQYPFSSTQEHKSYLTSEYYQYYMDNSSSFLFTWLSGHSIVPKEPQQQPIITMTTLLLRMLNRFPTERMSILDVGEFLKAYNTGLVS